MPPEKPSSVEEKERAIGGPNPSSVSLPGLLFVVTLMRAGGLTLRPGVAPGWPAFGCLLPLSPRGATTPGKPSGLGGHLKAAAKAGLLDSLKIKTDHGARRREKGWGDGKTEGGAAGPGGDFPQVSGLRVLVAEDDADSAVGLARFLRGIGHEVEVAPDGGAGKNLTVRHRLR